MNYKQRTEEERYQIYALINIFSECLSLSVHMSRDFIATGQGIMHLSRGGFNVCVHRIRSNSCLIVYLTAGNVQFRLKVGIK